MTSIVQDQIFSTGKKTLSEKLSNVNLAEFSFIGNVIIERLYNFKSLMNSILIISSNDTLFEVFRNEMKNEVIGNLFAKNQEVLQKSVRTLLMKNAGCKTKETKPKSGNLASKYGVLSIKCEKSVDFVECQRISDCMNRAKNMTLEIILLRAISEENYGMGTLFTYFR